VQPGKAKKMETNLVKPKYFYMHEKKVLKYGIQCGIIAMVLTNLAHAYGIHHTKLAKQIYHLSAKCGE
jgi:hypothetical protein